MVVWSEWLSYAADAIGVNSQTAGVMLSLLFTGIIILGALIASRGKASGQVIPILSLIFMIFFTYIGWLPLMVGSILGFIFAVWIAEGIAEKLRE